jgi:hypothetical protein
MHRAPEFGWFTSDNSARGHRSQALNCATRTDVICQTAGTGAACFGRYILLRTGRAFVLTARPSFAGLRLDLTVVIAQPLGMPTHAPLFPHVSPFRLVVKARTPIGPKSGFVWEIIRDDIERRVGRSSVS